MAHIDYSTVAMAITAPWRRLRRPPPAGARLGAVVNWAGALMSLGLVVGMSVWAFQLLMRDVSGVPVIEALEGPMREPPADPGGTQAPHQGLAVNRIAEGEEAQPVPDRLVLAPPPIELQEVRFEPADPAELTARAADGDRGRHARDGATRDAIRDDGTDRPPAAGGAARSSRSRRCPRRFRSAGRRHAGRGPRHGGDRRCRCCPPLCRASRGRCVPRRGPRPSSGASRSGAGAGAGPEEIAVTDLPDGTRLVQLGAFDTAEIAREEWDRIAGRFPEYFDDRPRVIEEAESGGQTFFRLRAAGFDDLAGSRRFCAVLVAQGTACIPVTVR
jgi:hypothetical protein